MLIKKKIAYSYLFPVILVLAFLVEAFYKVYNQYELQVSIITFFNAATVIGLIVILIYHKCYEFLLALTCLAMLWAIGVLFLKDTVSLTYGLKMFAKYITVLLFLKVASIVLTKSSSKILLQVFGLVLLINTAFIFLGFFFSLKPLATYYPGRFGYSGFLYGTSKPSYIYIIAMLYFAYKNLTSNSVLSLLGFVFISLGALLIGTKSIILGFGLVWFFWLWKRFNLALAIILGFTAMVLGIGVVVQGDIFQDILERQEFISLLLSNRNLLLTNIVIPHVKEYWSIINYLFGGFSNVNIRAQMAFVDLFYFFGFIGSIIYLLLFSTNFFKFNISRKKVIFLIGFFAIVAISGNFFFNAIFAVYCVVLSELFKTKNPTFI